MELFVLRILFLFVLWYQKYRGKVFEFLQSKKVKNSSGVIKHTILTNDQKNKLRNKNVLYIFNINL